MRRFIDIIKASDIEYDSKLLNQIIEYRNKSNELATKKIPGVNEES